MNGFLFDIKSKEQKVQEAIKLLEDEGYLIRGPLVRPSDVKGPSDLVKFFYDKIAQYNPDLLLHYASSKNRDMATAKKLIESRIDLGASKERAIVECCALVEALIKYEEYLGLSFKITSMSILGQDSMSWVTHKLTDLINGFNRELSAFQDEAWFSNFYKKQEGNIPEHLEQRAIQRLGLKDEDGKKEK